ncbi:hypothetical protein DL95DRAFT_471077 [Leptodontidium sp. 2 PMI_412]|nr:hypothetical protein DL95DRAFT_471077 [Leptodontidium sp. 2 PMI_412]
MIDKLLSDCRSIGVLRRDSTATANAPVESFGWSSAAFRSRVSPALRLCFSKGSAGFGERIRAGVIGLQTAILLLEAGYRVAIIGKHFPGHESIGYTSPWAGAHWRSQAPEADSEQQQWDMETYDHWLDVIEKERSHPGQKLLSTMHSIFS